MSIENRPSILYADHPKILSSIANYECELNKPPLEPLILEQRKYSAILSQIVEDSDTEKYD